MAEGNISDLLMKFVQAGQAIEGESSSTLALTKGPMTSGFTPGQMFEVESFQFRAGVSGDDEDSVAANKAYAQDKKQTARLNKQLQQTHRAAGAPGEPVLFDVTTPKPSAVGSFDKWRAGQDAKYPVDIAPVEFSRSIDKASAILLQNCIRRVTYDSATLIKRKAAGSASSGEVYIRFDFTGVLMTRIDWDDDVPVKEKCQFICRAVTVHYRPQLPDGTLGAPVQGFWTMSPDLKPVELRR